MPPKLIQPLLINLQETVQERLTQMNILMNHRGFPQIIKDEELKAQTRRNLRLIKQNELIRISQEDRNIGQIPSLKYFSKENVLQRIVLLRMLEEIGVKLMSKYLSVQFVALKRGLFQDLVILFQSYYSKVNMQKKVREMTVIKNLDISEQVNFAKKNIMIFVQHTRQSMNSLLNRERIKFYNATKDAPRQVVTRQFSQKRHAVSYDNDDQAKKNKKKQYSNYINQISKLLILQSFAMTNTTHFQKSQNVDNQRKISILQTTFSKKNQQVKESISDYNRQYISRSQKN